MSGPYRQSDAKPPPNTLAPTEPPPPASAEACICCGSKPAYHLPLPQHWRALLCTQCNAAYHESQKIYVRTA